MRPAHLLLPLLSSALAVLARPAQPQAQGQAPFTWPYSPFTTSRGDILNANGEKVILVGTNWPASGETMIPEGLEHQPLSAIVARLKEAGFNWVRHTYATQMIDEVYANGGVDVGLRDTMVRALGEADGARVTAAIVANNPQWNDDTPRFEVLADVARAEAEAGVLMHLDNHISRAMWCCGSDDGNAWFGDRDFDVQRWNRGLRYMANWARGHGNVQTMSLRNELRKSSLDESLEYSWVSWWDHVREAAEGVHATNPDLLITLSGIDFDIDLSAVSSQSDLRTAPSTDLQLMPPSTNATEPIYADVANTTFGRANKAVLELHAYKQSDFYSEDGNLDDCALLQASFFRFGFNAIGMDPPEACQSDRWEEPYGCPVAKLNVPVLLTEFGDAQDDSYKSNTLQRCLREFTTKHRIGWAQWSLAGSYRIRQGQKNYDDTWA